MSLLTTREASAILGVTDRRVRQLIDAGVLNGQRIGRDWLFPRDAVEGYAASRGQLQRQIESGNS